MRQRKTFPGAAWESLEGRQLLSTLTGLYQHTAHVQAAAHAHAVRGHARVSRTGPIVPGGPVGQSYTTLPAGGAVSARAGGRVSIPENNSTVPTGQVSAVTPTSPGGLDPRFSLGNPALRSRTSIGNLQPGMYLAQNTGGTASPLVLNPNQGAPAPAEAGSFIRYTPPSMPTTPPATPTTPATTTTTATGLTTPAPAGSLTPLPTSGAAMTAMPMRPDGLLGGVTLSAADVASLKTTVDAFAGSYTSGADAAKDTAAVQALQTGLDDLAKSLWSETHVVAKADVTAFQKAADAFATSYTSGANPAQDATAWASLQTALGQFFQAQNAAGAGTGNATGTGNAPVPMSVMPPMMMGSGPVMPGLDGLLLNGSPLSAGDVTTLKTAVDTFAGSYTSGADAAKDTAASTALETSLKGLISSRWAAAAPASDPGVMATGSATATAPTTPPSAPPFAGFRPPMFTAVRNPVTVPTTTTPSGQPNGMG